MASLKQQAKKRKPVEARISALSFGTQPENRKALRADLNNRLWTDRGNTSAKPRKPGYKQPAPLTAWGKAKSGVSFRDVMCA